MYSKIVVPLDGSKLAEQALEHARALAHCTGAAILLMRVMAYPNYDYFLREAELSAGLREEMEAEACNYLEPVAHLLQDEGLQVEAEAVVATGPVADSIIAFAREKGADLIVMSTHGRTGPSRWLLGSVADHVVRGAGMPVMMVRPVEKAGAKR